MKNGLQVVPLSGIFTVEELNEAVYKTVANMSNDLIILQVNSQYEFE